MNFPDERANDYRDPVPLDELLQGRRPEQVRFSEVVAAACLVTLGVFAVFGGLIYLIATVTT